MGAILTITALHYSTPTDLYHLHEIFRRLYYIPIILSAFWFGLRGAVFAAAMVSAVYLPHLIFQWGGDVLDNLSRLMEMVLYNAVGLVTGIMASAERVQRRKYERASEEAQAAYRELKAQTDRMMEMQDQLRAAERLSVLGELSAGMAHEIRNPLGTIKGAAEILEDPTSGEEQREFARILIKEVDRLDQILSRYLRFAQPSAMVRVRSELRRMIETAIGLSSAYARKAGVRIEAEMEDDLILEVEEGQIVEVFLNVLLNAIAASHSDDSVRIEGFRQDGEIIVRFVDEGVGIPEEDLPRIFLPLFSTRVGGTGLGLPIAKRIIEAHGARIEVESRMGEGTVVKIVFPLDQARREDETTASAVDRR